MEILGTFSSVCSYCEEPFGCKEWVKDDSGKSTTITSLCMCLCHRKGSCPSQFNDVSHGVCHDCYKKYFGDL